MLIANAAGTGAMTVEALTQMEAWLAAIHADDAPGTAAERMLRNRPVASDGRLLGGSTKIAEPFGLGLAGTCEALYPTFAETRMAAGSPLGERRVQVPAEAVRLRRLRRARSRRPSRRGSPRRSRRASATGAAGRRRAAAARRLARLRRARAPPDGERSRGPLRGGPSDLARELRARSRACVDADRPRRARPWSRPGRRPARNATSLTRRSSSRIVGRPPVRVAWLPPAGCARRGRACRRGRQRSYSCRRRRRGARPGPFADRRGGRGASPRPRGGEPSRATATPCGRRGRRDRDAGDGAAARDAGQRRRSSSRRRSAGGVAATAVTCGSRAASSRPHSSTRRTRPTWKSAT